MKYLFRLDMAKDNNEFLALRRGCQIDHVYSGTPMKVGPGWIPDFVEVAVDADSGTCRLTLIELEATEVPARAACRKYLPEASSEIVRTFLGYLDTVISQCHSTADPRLEAIRELKGILASRSTISVHTAGGLRTSADLVEDLSLIDQPESFTAPVTTSARSSSSFAFNGARRLTRAESDSVRRAMRILHAVVVGHDHSGGTMKSWRSLRQKPLDRAVSKDSSQYPHLHKLLTSKTDFGLLVHCDKLSAELALLWRGAGNESLATEQIATLISTFAPIAASFAEHEPMLNVFDQARDAISRMAI